MLKTAVLKLLIDYFKVYRHIKLGPISIYKGLFVVLYVFNNLYER